VISVLQSVWTWILNNPTLASGFIASLILGLGLGFSWWQLRITAREQQTDLLVHLSDRYDSDSLVKGRQAIWEITVQNKENLSQKIDELHRNDIQRYIQVTSVGNFFEDIGFLTKRHYLKLPSIKTLYKESIINYHNQFHEYIEKHKEEKTYEYFDWLAKEVNDS